MQGLGDRRIFLTREQIQGPRAVGRNERQTPRGENCTRDARKRPVRGRDVSPGAGEFRADMPQPVATESGHCSRAGPFLPALPNACPEGVQDTTAPSHADRLVTTRESDKPPISLGLRTGYYGSPARVLSSLVAAQKPSLEARNGQPRNRHAMHIIRDSRNCNTMESVFCADCAD
jgi:hypothetical protein